MEVKGKRIMMGNVKVGEERWRIIGVYVGRENMEEILRELGEWVEGKERGGRTIMGGDFNARTGREGGGVEEELVERWEEGGRRSKDERINIRQ